MSLIAQSRIEPNVASELPPRNLSGREKTRAYATHPAVRIRELVVTRLHSLDFSIFPIMGIDHVREFAFLADERCGDLSGPGCPFSPGKASAMNPSPPLALRAKDAAKALGISDRTLWQLTKDGHVPCVRLGTGSRKTILYPTEMLQGWLAARTQNTSDDCSEDPR